MAPERCRCGWKTQSFITSDRAGGPFFAPPAVPLYAFWMKSRSNQAVKKSWNCCAVAKVTDPKLGS
ncbi:hypothetical protein ASG07_07475 [Sphingomonas sp. Leaf343]|nr:hypothetical protein ASG07_07475 [Sphingomonas sp. Leaf343]